VLGIDYLGGARRGTRDQARAIAAVLDRLGVDRVHAIVGASYGGMVALAFAELFPGRLAHAVVISAAHRTHPMATALRCIQRQIVRLGIDSGREREALAIARQLAMTTYRTAGELSQRFAAEPELTPNGPEFPVARWLARAGERFADTFSADTFLALSESIDLHTVTPERVEVPITLVAVEHDTLVPLQLMRELRDRLPHAADWYVLESIYGHDAFLKEVDAVAAILRRALGRESGAGTRAYPCETDDAALKHGRAAPEKRRRDDRAASTGAGAQ
jgi:homoserine O-acetyltransferase